MHDSCSARAAATAPAAAAAAVSAKMDTIDAIGDEESFYFGICLSALSSMESWEFCNRHILSNGRIESGRKKELCVWDDFNSRLNQDVRRECYLRKCE